MSFSEGFNDPVPLVHRHSSSTWKPCFNEHRFCGDLSVFVSISGSKFEIKLQSLHAASVRVLLSPTHLQMYVAVAVLQG